MHATTTEAMKNMVEKVRSMPSRFEKIAYIFNELSYTRGAEIGVWKGDMARHVLGHVPSIQKYYLVDPWKHQHGWNKPFNKNSTEFAVVYAAAMSATDRWPDKREVLRGMSAEMSSRVPDRSLDFLYIDGDHTEQGTRTDVLHWWNKLKVGGGMYGDDFIDGHHHGIKFASTGVKTVITKFAKASRSPLHDLGGLHYVVFKVR